MAHVEGGRYLFLYLISLGMVMLGLLVSFQYNWPDFVHTDYGFPLVWGTHITVTMVGPIDQWHVNLIKLVLNIAIWLAASFLVSWALLHTARRA